MGAVIAAPLAAALGGGVLATAVSQIAVGVALSYVSNALFGQDIRPSQPDPITQKSRTSGTSAPQRLLLGRVKTTGHDLFPPYCHDDLGLPAGAEKSGKFMTLGIALSDLPVEGLHSIILQDLEFVIGTHLTDQSRTAGIEVPTGLGDEYERYRNKIWVRFYDGTQTAADPFMRTVFGAHSERPYTSDMIYDGGAYALLTIKYSQELWTNLSDIGWVVDGVKPNGTFTKNPARLANYLASGVTLASGDIYGPQMPFDPSWLSPAITACDTAGFEAGLEVQIGGPDGNGITCLDAIEDLLEACAGRAWDDGGTLRMLALDGGLPVFSITDQDILTSQGRKAEKAGAIKDRTNSVTITHPNSEELWAVKPAPTFTDNDAVTYDGERLPAALTYPAVSDVSQAQKLSGMLVADAQRVRLHTFALPLSFGQYTFGDKFTWTSSIHTYTNKEFRIETVKRMPSHTLITARETEPDDFDPGTVVLNPYTPRVVTPTGPGELVTGAVFTASNESDGSGGVSPGVLISVVQASAIASAVRWQIRLVGQTATLSGTFEPDGTAVFVSLSPGQNYEGRAQFVTNRRVAPWSAWQPFTTANIVNPTLQQLIDDAAQEGLDAQTGLLEIEQGLLGTDATPFPLGPNGEISISSAGVVINGDTLISGDAIVQGTLGADALAVGSGRNLLKHTDFSQLRSDGNWLSNVRPIGFVEASSGTASGEIRYSVLNAPDNPYLQVRRNNEASPTGFRAVRTAREEAGGGVTVNKVTPVEAGQYYMFSCYADPIGTVDTKLSIIFYDSSGSSLGSRFADIPDTVSAAGPEEYPRVHTLPELAPANAAFATCLILNYGNTNGSTSGNNAIVCNRWQLEQTHVNATGPAPYSDGSLTFISPDKIYTTADVFFDGGLSLFGGTLQSDTFVSGVSGWQIKADGSAQFAQIDDLEKYSTFQFTDPTTVDVRKVCGTINGVNFINPNAHIVAEVSFDLEVFGSAVAFDPDFEYINLEYEIVRKSGGTWTVAASKAVRYSSAPDVHKARVKHTIQDTEIITGSVNGIFPAAFSDPLDLGNARIVLSTGGTAGTSVRISNVYFRIRQGDT